MRSGRSNWKGAVGFSPDGQPHRTFKEFGMDKQPEELDISDVTQRTELHAEMNRHASWLINLALKLDLRSHHIKLIESRSFLARMIDATAKGKR